jgi:hypothetical protein
MGGIITGVETACTVTRQLQRYGDKSVFKFQGLLRFISAIPTQHLQTQCGYTTVSDLGNSYSLERSCASQILHKLELSISICVGDYIYIYIYIHIYVYIQESSVEIHTPTNWNLIGPGTTAPPPVLSPSSILPPPSSH